MASFERYDRKQAPILESRFCCVPGLTEHPSQKNHSVLAASKCSDGQVSEVPEDLDSVSPERDERREEGGATYEQPEIDVLSGTAEGGMLQTEDQSLAAGQVATEGEGGGGDRTVTEEGVAQRNGVGRFNLRPLPMPSCRLRDFVPL
ncbi:hypothetical protein NDU88_004001 [Pleurodeles waltl]|uniref:Uncharacterized protein n=1 Tax=Pleurodeles waltl TaxID=8319 RepID=A0AAV7SHI7_PLEWA|nr:hypothetical protein NDU88_004001 [Pleurodeles waltl]